MLSDILFDITVVTLEQVLASIVPGACPTIVQAAAYDLRELFHAERIDVQTIMSIWTSRN